MTRWMAWAAILLGAAHIIFGIIQYRALTPELIWFEGAGVALIIGGLANLAPHRWLIGINAVMVIYLTAMVWVMPLPQTILGLLLCLALTGLAVRGRDIKPD